MAKLYFKYGAMGSSKTAQALITKYNYEENDMQVWLIKPSADTRDGAEILRSRIGLQARVEVMTPDRNVYEAFCSRWQKPCHVIIVDECQFMTPTQIEQLRAIVDDFSVPVLCFGLRSDFLTHLFEGSKRLFEIADSITEIKSVCRCGKKAIVNARIADGRVVTVGDQIEIGGNDKYEGMCWGCWQQRIREGT